MCQIVMVTQLPNYIFKTFKNFNLSFCIPKYAPCWVNLHMRDGAIHYKLYLLKLTMAVDNIVFRIIKSLMDVFLYITIKWTYQPKHSPSSKTWLPTTVHIGNILKYCRIIKLWLRDVYLVLSQNYDNYTLRTKPYEYSARNICAIYAWVIKDLHNHCNIWILNSSYQI